MKKCFNWKFFCLRLDAIAFYPTHRLILSYISTLKYRQSDVIGTLSLLTTGVIDTATANWQSESLTPVAIFRLRRLHQCHLKQCKSQAVLAMALNLSCKYLLKFYLTIKRWGNVPERNLQQWRKTARTVLFMKHYKGKHFIKTSTKMAI
jgi:hypothetical protein